MVLYIQLVLSLNLALLCPHCTCSCCIFKRLCLLHKVITEPLHLASLVLLPASYMYMGRNYALVIKLEFSVTETEAAAL